MVTYRNGNIPLRITRVYQIKDPVHPLFYI